MNYDYTANPNHICDETRPYCFVSYSSKDSYCVHSVIKSLINLGVNVWIDWELENHIGSKWNHIVQNAIFNPNCKCLLWFVSEHSCISQNVVKELELSGSERVVLNHGGQAVKIYPLEISSIKPDNNIMSYCDILAQNAPQETVQTLRQLRNIICDNDAKRLSVRHVFTSNGQSQLIQSMLNDGFEDVVQNPATRYFEQYTSRTLRSCIDSSFLKSFDPILLPLLCKDTRDAYPRTADRIIDELLTEKEVDKNLLLIGGGGSGKTTLLLYLMQYLKKKGIHSVFIPLKEIGVTTIMDYAVQQLLPETNNRPSYFWQFLKSGKVVFLLDGINEVTPDNDNHVKSQIEAMLDQRIPVIFSTREINRLQARRYAYFEKCVHYNLVPLPEEHINQYLKLHNYPPVHGRTAELLSKPLLLKLYINQNAFRPDDHSAMFDFWKRQENEGCMIHNFLLLDCVKNWSDNSNKDMALTFAVLYLAPYLGWWMVTHSMMRARYRDFCMGLSNARAFYTDILLNDRYIDSGARNCENILFLQDYVNQLQDGDLIEFFRKTGILEYQADGYYSFFHQSFRDCLAATHCLNEIRLRPKSDNKALERYILPDGVLRYINDLADPGELDSYWRRLDTEFHPSPKSKTRMNMIMLLYLQNNASLSKVDFSKKDLRDISLNGFSLSDGLNGAKFRRALISNYTFAPPIVHTDYITAIAINPEGNYIVSGSNNGEIIIYDAAMAQPIGSFRYKDGTTSAVKAVIGWNGHLCICYANGLVLLTENWDNPNASKVLMEAVPGDSILGACLYEDSLFLAFYFRLVRIDLTEPIQPKIVCKFENVDLTCIASCDNSDYLYCGCSDGSIIKYDVLTNETDRWQGHADSVYCLAVKGNYLFSCAADHKVLRWNINEDKPDENWNWDIVNARTAYRIAISEDERYLLAASTDGNLTRINASSGRVEHFYQFSATRGIIHTICVAPDGGYLITDGPNNSLVVRRITGNDPVYKDQSRHTGSGVAAINVSANGKYAIMQILNDRSIECTAWDLEKAIPYYRPIILRSLRGLKKAISSDGRLLYLGQGENFMMLDTQNPGTDSSNALERYKGWLFSILLHERTKTVWMGCNDRYVYQLNLEDASLKLKSNELDATINCFCETDSTDIVFAGDWAGSIHKMGPDANILASLHLGQNAWVNDLCTSYDGEYVYAALNNGWVIKTDTNLSQVLSQWQYKGKRRWDKPSVESLTVDQESNILIAISGDDVAFVLNPNDLSVKKSVDLRSRIKRLQPMRSTAQIKGSGCVLIGDENGDMCLYDLLNDQMIKTYHKISNICLVGCDFRGAIFPNDGILKEEIRQSGAKGVN